MIDASSRINMFVRRDFEMQIVKETGAMTVEELIGYLGLCKKDAIVLDPFGKPITGFRTEDEDGVAEVVLESGK